MDDNDTPTTLKEALKDAILKRAEDTGIQLTYSSNRSQFVINKIVVDDENNVVKPILEYVISSAMSELVGLYAKSNFPIVYIDDTKPLSFGGRIQKKNKKSTRRRNRK